MITTLERFLQAHILPEDCHITGATVVEELVTQSERMLGRVVPMVLKREIEVRLTIEYERAGLAYPPPPETGVMDGEGIYWKLDQTLTERRSKLDYLEVEGTITQVQYTFVIGHTVS